MKINESLDKLEQKRIKERQQIVVSTVFEKDDVARPEEYQPVKLLSSQSGSNKGPLNSADHD
jgi:hypothetical protein